MSRDAVGKPRRRSWITFGVTTVVLGIVEVTILLLPVVRRYFDEYGLQLTTPTKVLLEVSWIVYLVVYGWWAVLLLSLIVNWHRTSFVISRMSSVMAGAIVMSIAMPLIKLHECLSK